MRAHHGALQHTFLDAMVLKKFVARRFIVQNVNMMRGFLLLKTPRMISLHRSSLVVISHIRCMATTATEMPSKLSDLALSQRILSSLEKAGIVNLMPIQQATLAHLRSGCDVIARAKTGSGKTLAFLLPIVEKLTASTRKPNGKPFALIIGEWVGLWFLLRKKNALFSGPVRFTCGG
jgi:hypothetical protein